MLEIGGQKIQPGVYYLGLHCDQEGKFSLLVMDANKALKSGWVPFAEDAWKPEVKAPLVLNKDSLPKSATKMEVAITLDENKPSTGKFTIRWGKHELAADVTAHLHGGAKNAAADKGK